MVHGRASGTIQCESRAGGGKNLFLKIYRRQLDHVPVQCDLDDCILGCIYVLDDRWGRPTVGECGEFNHMATDNDDTMGWCPSLGCCALGLIYL
jgi:hypothetical protein